MVYQKNELDGFTRKKNCDVSGKTRMVDKKIGDSSILDTDSYVDGSTCLCTMKPVIFKKMGVRLPPVFLDDAGFGYSRFVELDCPCFASAVVEGVAAVSPYLVHESCEVARRFRDPYRSHLVGSVVLVLHDAG